VSWVGHSTLDGQASDVSDVEADGAMQVVAVRFNVCRIDHSTPSSTITSLLFNLLHRTLTAASFLEPPVRDSHSSVLQRFCQHDYELVSSPIRPCKPSFPHFSRPHTWHPNPRSGSLGRMAPPVSPVEALCCSGSGMHASGLGFSRSEARNSNPPRSELASSGTDHDA
jgi:hypothetical protein